MPNIGNFFATYNLPVPSVEDVIEGLNPPIATNVPPKDGEIVALARAVYSGVQPAAYDSHLKLAAQMGRDYGDNLWILSTRPRLPYPFAPLYALGCMILTENARKRKCDWILWLDDDVIVPYGLMRKLREVADPAERPFVAVVGHDRGAPFKPAVWDFDKVGRVTVSRQWETETMPKSGVHRVDCTGLCAALWHRSLFEKIPQPWFISTPGEVFPDGGIEHKINPDSWFCEKCRENNIPIHVCCDITIAHLGDAMPIHSKSAPVLAQIFRKRKGSPAPQKTFGARTR